MDLPGLGADWEHKDIFVEVDYMGSSWGHNHKPNPTAISDVIQAFANAPVSNPDGRGGINLHVLVDQEIPHTFEITWEEFLNIKNTMFGTEADQNVQTRITLLLQETSFSLLSFYSQTNRRHMEWQGRSEGK